MKRSSVHKAEWSESREKSYKAYCDEILFHRKIKILFVESNVYLKTENEEIFLTVIPQPKQTWYETWKALKDKFGVDGVIDKK